MRLKSQNVRRVPGTVSSRVLAMQYQLCYHYHYFELVLFDVFGFLATRHVGSKLPNQ